jgi:hypothetical protein
MVRAGEVPGLAAGSSWRNTSDDCFSRGSGDDLSQIAHTEG